MSDPTLDPSRVNRLSWNAATVAHNSHKVDQARFFREGGDTLFPEELALLGPLDGRRLLHLQCNAGQDSLSLARRGAKVKGVDLSDEAVRFARKLSEDSGIRAEFEEGDVLRWLPEAGARGERFDLAFSSYGAVGWLPDLGAWARGIRGVLAQGGRFVLVEFHPFAWLFDEQLKLTWPYSTHGAPIHQPLGVSDYVARSGAALAPMGYDKGVEDFQNPNPCMEYAWGLGDVVTALCGAGLVIERLDEYPYANGCTVYDGMRPLPGNRWTVPDGVPELPLMFGLAARAP